ncbi:type II toxin-antitoxin system VapC family toxin [Acidisoma silvae]|uniref:Ribonuclease VapC n=1 Tax=Acidisoma silvae TaxID=2802396 RepID=A0A963YUK3_9PROT|nr:type II toxin-antitoxin system VapC family toxin [Acidisoma silvae]MCB8877357.1 type II toxin-antitoxin system VapC family toxin [Acidisoma silvae]
MILLDTNVISELAKPSPMVKVAAWANAQPTATLYATAIAEAELLFGLTIMPLGARRQMLERAVATIFGAYLAGRVFPFDRAAAEEYALWAADRRRIGRPVATADLQIAAIARARQVSAIATRNTRDFAGCGVPVIDPWQ